MHRDGLRRRTPVVAIVALLAVALCVVVIRLARTSDPGPSSRTAGLSREVAALRRPGARPEPLVRAQADNLWALQDDALSTAMRGAAETQVPMVPGPADVVAARAEEERLHREYIARIDAAFRAEATDPQWSSATSSAIRGVVAGDESLRGSLRGVDCKSSTCRVEIADDGSGALDKALPMFVHQLAPQLPSVAADRIDDGRGAASMVLYMSSIEDPAAGSPD